MITCAWTHQAQNRSWRPYVLRTPDVVMRTSPSHLYYPWQVSYDGDFNRWSCLYIKEVQPQDALSIKFLQDPPLPCHKHVGAIQTQHFSWRRNRQEPFSRGCMDRCCYYHFKTSFKPGRKCRRRRELGRSSKNHNRRSCPNYPARRGD